MSILGQSLGGFVENSVNRDGSAEESMVTEQSGSRGGGGKKRKDVNSEDESSKIVSTSSGNDLEMNRKRRGAVLNGSSMNETLLFTTMCIIGLPVEVHIKDGSVYSGIFHTACVENDYGVVLKKAKMIKKGKNDANVANGALIETLVVLSGDLVQVVAKGVLLPSDGAIGNVAGDSVEPVDCTIPCPEKEAKTTKSSKFALDRKHFDQTRINGDDCLVILLVVEVLLLVVHPLSVAPMAKEEKESDDNLAFSIFY